MAFDRSEMSSTELRIVSASWRSLLAVAISAARSRRLFPLAEVVLSVEESIDWISSTGAGSSDVCSATTGCCRGVDSQPERIRRKINVAVSNAVCSTDRITGCTDGT